MTEFSTSFIDVVNYFKQECRCFDLVIRNINYNTGEFLIVFVGGVTGSDAIQPILESIAMSDPLVLFPATVNKPETMEDALLAVLQGQTLVVQNQLSGWIVDTRQIPGRTPSEPTVEKSIRGSRDGFVEHLLTNLGLIRKRIKDTHLVIESMQFGSRTHTDIAIFYIDDLVDAEAKKDVYKRLNSIGLNTDVHSERHLSELMYGQSFNPYPHVRYTERPDLVSMHLLQGNVAVLVDQSPTAILVPATFFETTSQIEEYTQTYLISVVLRIFRNLGVLASLYLLPIWMCAVLSNQAFFLVPEVKIENAIIFGFQVLIADGLIEWIRLSLIHSPTLLSSMLGLIAVFVLGDTAISYGAYTQEILIAVAVVNIGNFVTSSYEISMANKISRMYFVICIMFFKTPGFIIGLILHLIILATTKSGGKPYLYPLIPLNIKELWYLFFGDFSKTKKRGN